MDKTGFKKSIHGINYQLKLLAFFLKRGLDKGYTFRLGSETNTGCFDDIFFEFETENGKIIRLVQAKHKLNNNKKITKEELMKDGNCNFGLPKYFSSYREIMRNTLYTNDDTKIQDFIIFTNMDIDQNLQANFDSIESDDILHYDDRECKLLKIKYGELKKQIVQKLTNNSCKMLKYLATAKNVNFENESLKQYRSVLAREVFEVLKENGLYYVKFSESFINSEKMIEFKTVFFQYWMPETIFDINKMRSWKKLALNFLNNEKPLISNVQDFVKEIIREIVRAKGADRIVYLTRRNKIIKDNIDKLSEHLLIIISDEEKDLYYFNEEFFDDICELKGNLNDFRSELKKELRTMKIGFTRDEYKFCIKNFPYQKNSLPTDYVTDEEMEGFLNKLILAVNQPNEVELGYIIAKEISSNSIANEFIMSKFQIYMLDWLKDETAKLLTEKDAKQFFQDTSTNLRMSDRTEEYIADIKKLGVTFNSDAIIELNTNFEKFLHNSQRILNIITEYTDLSSIKFHQILTAKTNYNYIFLSLNSFLEFGEAFRSQTNNLLVIVLENVLHDLLKIIHTLKSIMNENSKGKIIFIGSSAMTFLNAPDFNNDKYEDINLNFTDLTLESQKNIFSKEIVSFQGHPMNLDKLLNSKLYNVIDGNILSNLIHKQKLKIGAELSSLGEIEHYYVPRTLQHCVHIDPAFKKKTEMFYIIDENQYRKLNKQDIFFNPDNRINLLNFRKNENESHFMNSKENNFLSDLNKFDDLNEKTIETCIEKMITTNFEFSGIKNIEPNDQQDIIFISDGSDGYFEQLCIKYSRKNIHWLKNVEERLIWKQSYGGNLSKLRDFMDKNTLQFIEPTIATNIREKLVVIVAEPGMGKSILLTHLALQTKKSETSLLILKIHLIDNAERFQSLQKKKTCTETDINDFLYSCYLEKTNEGPIKTLEKTVFDYCFQEGKIIVMFDGFDEISPDYKNVVIKILKALRITTIGGLWITTRPYNIQSEIENVLNTFSYSLQPISKENQISFLKFYWTPNLKVTETDNRFNMLIKEFLERFSKITNDKNGHFLTSPLQLRMIAEIFQNKFEELINSGSHELSKNVAQMFGEEFHLVVLYEKFIEIKFDKILLQEKKTGFNTADPDIRTMIQDKRINFIEKHNKLALLSLFGTDGLKMLNIKIGDLVTDINKGKEKTGIIDRVIEEKPIFVHKSYAEYFAALWFADNWEENKVKSFLLEHIFQEENNGIRSFFDYLLAYERNTNEMETDSESDSECENAEEKCISNQKNKYELHAAVLNNDVDNILKILESKNTIEIISSLDKGGRTALHLIASYNCTEVWNKVNSEQIKFLIDLKDKIFGFTPLIYAQKCGSWNIADSLLEAEANHEDMFKEIDNSNEQYKGPNNLDTSHPNMTLLHVATSQGLLTLIKVLIKTGSDLYAPDRFGSLPLHYAASHGDHKIVAFFIKHAEQTNAYQSWEFLNAKQFNGATALHEAAVNGKTEVVELLLKSVEKSKPDKLFEFIQEKNEIDLTVLHLSAQEGQTEVVALLLKLVETQFPSEIWEFLNAKQINGATALHEAAVNGKTEVVELLLKSVEKLKPDKLFEFIQEKTKNNNTALHLSAQEGQTEVVELLLKSVEKSKPDKLFEFIQEKNEIDLTALHLSAYEGQTEVVELLLKSVEKLKPDKLFEFIQEKTKNNNTALHISAHEGKTEVVELLIKLVETKLPAQVWEFLTAKQKYGCTVLHLAAEKARTEVVELLIKSIEKSNPDKLLEFVNVKTLKEMTALHIALMFKHPDIIKHLIKYKANVVERNDHDTILHQAVSMNNEEILQLILNEIKRTEPNMVPFINVIDTEGDTPLMWAAEHGRLEMAKILLEYEPNIDLQNNDGYTALHWATKGGYYETVKLLLTKNANSNINDKNGKTPIKLAVEIWNKDLKNKNTNLITNLLSQW